MKAIPVFCMQASTWAGDISILTPKASKTSAAPHRLDTDRFPCLATGMPQAAARMLEPVEMLIVPARSPPVPAMSIRGKGTSTGRA